MRDDKRTPQMGSIFPLREKVSLDREPEPRLVDLDDETADEVFEALSSRTTREIFLELHSQPQTASDLAEVTETSVQNVQYHLEKLTDIDLVEVVDTWYSERGSEMKVYAPADESLVVFAGRDKQSAFRRLLDRFAGVFAVLIPPSILAGWLANRRDTGVEEGIRAEYAVADDTDDVEDDAPADESVEDEPDEVEDAEVDAAVAEDDAPAETDDEAEDTPAPDEETPAPDDELEAELDAANIEEGDIEVSVNESFARTHEMATENETIYLLTEAAEGSDVMGVDPAVAGAFFLGGLVVYGAVSLRRQIV